MIPRYRYADDQRRFNTTSRLFNAVISTDKIKYLITYKELIRFRLEAKGIGIEHPVNAVDCPVTWTWDKKVEIE